MVGQPYIDAFVKAAGNGDMDIVRKCLLEHPEVINLKESEVCNA